jgi:hypothetical protein
MSYRPVKESINDFFQQMIGASCLAMRMQFGLHHD